jgi:phosphoglycolate phosphatase-like HAD superfamily hydrolase
MIKNLIFDWSGTLANDLGSVLHATNATLEQFGKRVLTAVHGVLCGGFAGD